MAPEADPPNASNASWLRTPISKSFSYVQAPHCSSSRFAKSCPNASNPLQILYKTGYFGASCASRIRRPIRQILLKSFSNASNPLLFWSLRRLMSKEADPPSLFQMLQILYKSFIKLNILEPRTPHGSGRRSAESFSNASNPLHIVHKTEHFGASGASWHKQPICKVVLKCFKSFTNPLQNW